MPTFMDQVSYLLGSKHDQWCRSIVGLLGDYFGVLGGLLHGCFGEYLECYLVKEEVLGRQRHSTCTGISMMLGCSVDWVAWSMKGLGRQRSRSRHTLESSTYTAWFGCCVDWLAWSIKELGYICWICWYSIVLPWCSVMSWLLALPELSVVIRLGI